MMPNCYLCGCADTRTVETIGEWRILKCTNCDLGWLDPRPESTSDELYGREYFSQHRIMTAETDEELAAKVAAQGSRVRFIRRYRDVGRLLDIGCASGHFLARARESSYVVQGLETSEWAVQEGRKRLGLDIEQGTVETAEFEEASFDVITLWHVVEHLDDPIRSLSTVLGWLKPGGALVLECPNSGSFDAGKYGPEWPGWSIPYHLWHFTPRSLSAVLDRAGYEVVGIQTLPSQWLRERLRRIPLLGLARILICPLFTGRDMRLVARPKA